MGVSFVYACLFAVVMSAVSIQDARGAKRQISYDDIAKGRLTAKSVSGLRPMSDGEHYTTLEGGDVLRWRYVDGVLVDTLFKTVDGFAEVTGYAMSDDESKMLITTAREQIYRHSSRAEYYVYDLLSEELKQLSENGKQQEATLSPDGTKAAFVRANNLFVVELATDVERQITHDGKAGHIINGIPDWVYEEEYSFSRGYEWSPGSDAIAFYRFDESGVKEFSMNTFKGKLYPQNYDFKYPKAGEDNSQVEIKVFSFDADSVVNVDLEQADVPKEWGGIYIPCIEWVGSGDSSTSDGEAKLAVHWLNRLQNHYRVLMVDAVTGVSRLLYEQKDARYIDRVDKKTLTFLPDDKGFVVKSERDGWRHLYLYDMEGELQNRITDGEWEVTDVCGVDSRRGRVYFQSTEESPLGRGIYSVGLNGRGKQKLSPYGDSGTHSAVFGAGYKYYIDYFSNSTTPTVVTLRQTADGQVVRVLEDNADLRGALLSDYSLPRKEFFTFTTDEGVVLNGYILKPADFDSTRHYPLLMTQYGGPGSQRVAHSWGWSWEAALLREGVLVACVDGRGTGFRGEEFRKCTYGNLGGLEMDDQIEAAKYMGSLSYIDSKRIGIYGWSYGGFMALNSILKGGGVFALAVAVAPVTSWRYYDTIYTELYNGLPQDNAAGYDDNSPIHFAHLLEGKLLLAHGTGDDNVHVQNSYEMIEQLVAADKSFEMLIYPDENHGMGSSRDHLLRRAIEFVKSGL